MDLKTSSNLQRPYDDSKQRHFPCSTHYPHSRSESLLGAIQRPRTAKRCEIGHGKLPQRASVAAVCTQHELLYVLCAQSNIMEIEGSSSIPSMCGGCLELQEAEVLMNCFVDTISMVNVAQNPQHATNHARAISSFLSTVERCTNHGENTTMQSYHTVVGITTGKRLVAILTNSCYSSTVYSRWKNVRASTSSTFSPVLPTHKNSFSRSAVKEA